VTVQLGGSPAARTAVDKAALTWGSTAVVPAP
jgi:hypothetical protein